MHVLVRRGNLWRFRLEQNVLASTTALCVIIEYIHADITSTTVSGIHLACD